MTRPTPAILSIFESVKDYGYNHTYHVQNAIRYLRTLSVIGDSSTHEEIITALKAYKTGQGERMRPRKPRRQRAPEREMIEAAEDDIGFGAS